MYRHNGLGALETLTRTVADSVTGCKEAADHARSPDLRRMLEQLAADRVELHGVLQSQLSRRGGPSNPGGSTLGHLHHAWLDLKAHIPGSDDVDVIEEVIRGEDYLKEKFETVMSREAMDEDIRTILERAYHRVCNGRDLAVECGSRLEVTECVANSNLASPQLR